MARCLAPITIPNPAVWEKRQLKFLRDKPALFRYGRDNLRPILSEVITVPCGKCLACLKNKQSSMVVRCRREAEQRGSFAFMTLTYDDDHLPIVETMWKHNLSDGTLEQVSPPEFVSTGFHPEPEYLKFFRGVDGTDSPRYKIFIHCRILQYEWQHRITPSVCRKDVQQWLKQARIQYERDYGEKLPDFSYVAISEYGSRTCRPHYHLAFFGLKAFHLRYLLAAWKFGKVKQFRMVSCTNKDGSSGYTRASKYIGKYMAKGKFECDSVKCGDAQRPRVCQSMHFGTEQLDSVRRFVLCQDMFGDYDIDTFVRPDGSRLSRIDIDSLVREIPKRLVYRVDEKTVLPLPRIIRNKIFNKTLISNGECWRVVSGSEVYDRKEWSKEKEVSSTLWCLVASFIRDNFDRDRDEQFAAFCAGHPERTLSENYSEFAYFEEFRASLEDASLHEDFRTFYSKSKF